MDMLLPILPTITSQLIPNVGNPPNTASATNILPQVMNLPAGTMLHGQVTTPRNALGHIVIKTDKGELALKTDIFVKRGMEMIIRLDKAGDELMAKLISIDGKSVGKYVESLQASIAQEETDTIIRTTATADEVVVDGESIDQRTLANIKQAFSEPKPAVMKAILAFTPPLAPPQPQPTALQTDPVLPQPVLPNAPQIAAPTQNAPVGSQFSITIAALQLPQQAPIQLDPSVTLTPALLRALPQPQPQPLTPETHTSETPKNPLMPQDAPALKSPATPVLLHPPAPPTRANVIAAYQQLQPSPAQIPAAQTPPTTPTNAPSTPAILPAPAQKPNIPAAPVVLPPHTIPAQVIASHPQGEISLQTDLGVMRMFAPEPLPVGTTLLLDIKDMKLPLTVSPEAAQQTLSGNTAPPTSERPFNGFGTLASLLPAPANNAAIADYRFSPIPRAGKEMLADVMFFLSALKGGDSQKWLGERNSRTLQQSKHADLLGRITGDFQQLQSSMTQASPETTGQWQQLTFPLMVNHFVDAVQLYHRSHRQDGDEESQSGERESKPNDQTDHFILGVKLSHFGEVQLDGFVRKPPRLDGQKTTFELVIRSQIDLPDSVQQDIRTIFINAQEITGCTGALSFRSGAGACLALNELTPAAKPSAGHQSIIA